MSRPNKPPTHTLWSQHREHGRFREWYKSGHVWIEKNETGETIDCTFQPMHASGGDDFTWFFPVGTTPPPPTETRRPQRPDTSGENDET